MRHRMSKQADAILGMYLYSNLFTEEELKRNYDFYQEVTLHHSSLSTCILSLIHIEMCIRDSMNAMYPTDYNTPEVEKATTDLQTMLPEYTTADAVLSLIHI